MGWSVIRLVKRFAEESRVNDALLMGAIAGYLNTGLTAGLVMSALETIQPGRFKPLVEDAVEQESVFVAAEAFSALNYYAFVCLTTIGFGNINTFCRWFGSSA